MIYVILEEEVTVTKVSVFRTRVSALQALDDRVAELRRMDFHVREISPKELKSEYLENAIRAVELEDCTIQLVEREPEDC